MLVPWKNLNKNIIPCFTDPFRPIINWLHHNCEIIIVKTDKFVIVFWEYTLNLYLKSATCLKKVMAGACLPLSTVLHHLFVSLHSVGLWEIRIFLFFPILALCMTSLPQQYSVFIFCISYSVPHISSTMKAHFCNVSRMWLGIVLLE